jgi:hypothetical protein
MYVLNLNAKNVERKCAQRHCPVVIYAVEYGMKTAARLVSLVAGQRKMTRMEQSGLEGGPRMQTICA